MELIALLKEMDKAKIRLYVQAGELRFRAPKGALTPSLGDAIRSHRPTLIRMLSPSRIAIAKTPLDCAPLTSAQQQLWVSYHRWSDGSAAKEISHIPLIVDLEGDLDTTMLFNTVTSIVQRQTALQLRFRYGASGLEQWRDTTAAPPMSVQTVTGDLDNQTRAFVAKPFALLHELPHRLCLIQQGERKYRFIWCFHHIIFDGWSMSLVLQQLIAQYSALINGDRVDQAVSIPHPDADIDFLDVVHFLQQQRYDVDMRFWRESLQNIPAQFSGLKARASSHHNEECGYREWKIDNDLLARLNTGARQLNVSLCNMLVAAYGLLLYRLSNQTRFCIAMPEAGRQHAMLENITGLLVNTFLLKFDMDTALSLRAYVQQQAQIMQNAMQHAHVPVERIIAELKPSLDDDFPPYRQLGFSYLKDMVGHHHQQSNSVANVCITPVVWQSRYSRYALNMMWVDGAGMLSAQLEYDKRYFQEEDVTALLACYQDCLEALLTRADQSVTAIAQPLWRHDFLPELESVPSASLHQRSIVETLLSDKAASAIAIREQAIEISYIELNKKVSRRVAQLLQIGVRARQWVLVDVERNHHAVEIILSLWAIGAVYCPVYRPYSPAVIKKLLEDRQIQFVISDQLDTWDFQAGPAVKCVDVQQLLTSTPLFHAEPLQCFSHEEDDLLYVIHTSGTTGAAKAIGISAANVRHYLASAQQFYQLTQADRVLFHTALAFDVSLLEMMLTLAQGACLCVKTGEGLLDAAELSDLLHRHQISVVYFTASHWHRLVVDPKLTLPASLRMVANGAETLSPHKVRHWFKRFGERVRLINHYGPSETTIGILGYDIRSEDTAADHIPIGHPFAGVIALICDEWGKPVVGEGVGELFLAGPTLAKGYVNNSEQTQACFVTRQLDNAHGQLRFYKTGDLVQRRKDGAIIFLGRVDQQIKWRGFRIELAAINHRLMAHPDIDEARVVAEWNSDKTSVKHLHALLKASENKRLTDQQLRQWLETQLPAYMSPSRFHWLAQILLAANGKPDYSTVKHLFDMPAAPEGVDMSATQRWICQCWQQLLNTPIDDIHRNFFDYGGYSLLLLELQEQIRKHFALEIVLVDLFQHTTVYTLARFLDQHQHHR